MFERSKGRVIGLTPMAIRFPMSAAEARALATQLNADAEAKRTADARRRHPQAWADADLNANVVLVERVAASMVADVAPSAPVRARIDVTEVYRHRNGGAK